MLEYFGAARIKSKPFSCSNKGPSNAVLGCSWGALGRSSLECVLEVLGRSRGLLEASSDHSLLVSFLILLLIALLISVLLSLAPSLSLVLVLVLLLVLILVLVLVLVLVYGRSP